MVTVDTREYVSMLKELVDEGKEVSMLISGNSMAPFLVHARDYICFKKPDRSLKKGDMVFYQRDDGRYVMHRICKVRGNSLDLIGDNQREIEHGVRREQVFALITKVKRKEKWIHPGDFYWEFFSKVWINVIPFRRILMRLYGHVINGGRHGRKTRK